MERLSDIVASLDAALSTTALADFYDKRKALKGGHRWRGPLLLIQKGADVPLAGYAYHKGGREELQFNVGFEDNGAYFRYGVAFSLEPGRGLPDPVAVLAPKIARFNRIVTRFPELASLKLWFHYEARSPSHPFGPIPDEWVRRGAFVFVGERVPVPRGGISPAMIRRAAEVLVMLLPLYLLLEGGTVGAARAPVSDYRVARLCWNTDFWQRPTGRKGKSRNRKAFEAQHGYGHEEWLFDRSMLLDGWKYGFVQALNHSHDTYVGRRLALLLYTLDTDSKRRFWVGTIDALEVLTVAQARQATREFTRRGWLKAMRRQVAELGLDPGSLSVTKATELLNVRFRPEALQVFDPPAPFPAGTVRSTYYGTLQDVPTAQAEILGSEEEAEALIERNLRVLKTTRHVYENDTEVDLVQTQWQQLLRKTLREDLPGVQAVVETKVDGHRLDAVLVQGTRRIFVELKTRGTVRQVIREALSQLLEYAYWPAAQRCQSLLIVGAAEAGTNERAYLTMLRERFGLPVHYLQYKEGRIAGIADWFRALPE